MADISKGKRSTGRRSSILKRALADIDVNVRDKNEVTRRISKRVSFAETCAVKEFPRDSPQFTKAAENKDADTSAESNHFDAEIAADSNQPVQDAGEPCVDNLAVAGCSFILDEAETTFVCGMESGDYLESTRMLDRLDGSRFGETDTLDISEIVPGDNSVFGPAPVTQCGAPSVIASASVPSANKRPAVPVVNNPLAKMTGNRSTQCEGGLTGQQFPMNKVMDYPVPRMNFLQDEDSQHFENRTVLFGDQDEGTMDLTLGDTSRSNAPMQPFPKISGRDFLNMFKNAKAGQGCGKQQVRGEQTILFSSNNEGGNQMEFTQNLPSHNVTAVTCPIFKPAASLQGATAQVSEDKTILFSNKNAADDMNLTRNLSPMNMSTDRGNKVTAKSFLASLRGDRFAVPAALSAPSASTVVPPLAQPSCGQEQTEDMTMTMEMTDCLDTVNKPNIQPSLVSSAFKGSFQLNPPQFLAAQKPQQGMLAAGHDNVTEMMEQTLVDDTRQLLVDANSSVVAANNLSEGSNSKSPSRFRNALVDITSRYTSPPSPMQAPVEQVGEVAEVRQSQSSWIESSSAANVMSTEQGKGMASSKAEMVRIEQDSTTTSMTGGEGCRTTLAKTAAKTVEQASVALGNMNAMLHDQENRIATARTGLLQRHQGNRAAMTSLHQDDKELASSTIEPASGFLNRSVHTVFDGHQSDRHPAFEDAMNRTVRFTAEETEAEMEMTGVFADNGENNRTVRFTAEETEAEMEMTGVFADNGENKLSVSILDHGAAEIPVSQLASASSQGNTLIFQKGETRNDMSFTCQMPSTVNLMIPETCHTQTETGHSFRHTKLLEQTAADMSMTCTNITDQAASSQMNKLQEIKQLKGPSKPAHETSIVYNAEETGANMSLTCSLHPHTLSPKQPPSNQNVTGAEEMDLTSTGPTSVHIENKVPSNRDVLPKTEVMDMSLTCATASLLPGKLTVQASMEKSGMFKTEETAANMSLTCVNISQKEPDRDRASTTGTDYTGMGQPSDKSIVFSAEATAGNTSLTCVDFPSKQVLVSEQTQNCEEDESAVLKSNGRQYQKVDNVVTAMGLTDIGCTSSRLQSLSQNTQSGSASSSSEQDVVFSTNEVPTEVAFVQPVASESATCKEGDVLDNKQLNTSDTANSVISVPKSNSMQRLDSSSPGQMEVSVPETAETEEREDNAFCNKEPTILMELTGVFAQMKKKLEEQSAAQEAETDNKAAETVDAAQNSAVLEQQQPRPDCVRLGSSRKLLLSPTSNLPQTPFASHMLLTDREKTGTNKLSHDFMKRHLQPHDAQDDEPKPKNYRLDFEARRPSGSSDCVSQQASNRNPKNLQVLEPLTVDVNKTKTNNPVSLTAKVTSSFTGTENPPVQLDRTSSSSSSSTKSPDIFGEIMPVFFPTRSNTSGAVSVSVTHNMTGSSLSLGRSFVDKQITSDQPDNFLKTCEQLGIEQFRLTGRVCRRSSGIVRPDLTCETLKDRLNLTSVVQEECDSKSDFFHRMAAIVQSEEASSEELEKTVMHQVRQQNLVAEAELSPSLRQQIHELLNISKKQTQAAWKTHKAQMLNTLTQNMKVRHEAVLKDMSDITYSAERMASVIQSVNHQIETLQSETKSAQSRVSSRKHSGKHHQKEQQLNQRNTELAALQEQVLAVKGGVERLHQKESELLAERNRSRQRCEANTERQRQLTRACDTLSALHSLHCWRSVHVEDQRVDCLLLHDSVLLSIGLSGTASAQQPVVTVTVTSRLKEGSESWAALAARLTVETLSASCQQLVDKFTTRGQLQQMLDEVTRIVENIKSLCLEVKLASLRHKITIKDKQVTTDLWSMERLCKVSLCADIPINSSSLVWNAQVIMGDISESQIQKAVAEAGVGRRQFTAVLQAVQNLIQQ